MSMPSLHECILSPNYQEISLSNLFERSQSSLFVLHYRRVFVVVVVFFFHIPGLTMSTVAELEINGEIFEQIEKETDKEDAKRTDDGKAQVENELSMPPEQSRLDSVKKLSSGIYHTASDALGYGMDSVKRAATGLGAGLTRAGQNVADKIQKSPKIPKSMKKRTEIDDLSSSGLLNDSDDDDDRESENSTLVSRKSSKEMAARKKRQDALKKERE